MGSSIRKRLFAILGVFVLCNALVWSGMALLLAYVVEDEIIDRVLATQVSRIVENYSPGGPLPEPGVPEIRLFESVDAAPPAIRDQIEGPPGRGEIFTEEETHYHYRWFALPRGADVLLLAEVSPWLVVTSLSPALMILLLAGLVLATGLGLVAVAMIAGITTRPVRELTAAIESDPRPDPLPHLEKQDEVGTLASAMDAALGNLQEALARERAFTRDVSHELRTPLTTLRNALTLMPRSVESSAHLSQLRNSSDEIERTLASLLALARAESAVLEPMKLRPLLETLLLERSRILESRGFELNVEVPDAAERRAASRISETIMALHQIPGVVSLTLTYHHFEDQQGGPSGQPQPVATCNS